MYEKRNHKRRNKPSSFRDFIATTMVAVTHRVQFDPPVNRGNGLRINFRFFPRKWVIYLMMILFFWVFVLLVGVVGLINMFKDTLKVQDFSSYYFDVSSAEEARHPSAWEACKKF